MHERFTRDAVGGEFRFGATPDAFLEAGKMQIAAVRSCRPGHMNAQRPFNSCDNLARFCRSGKWLVEPWLGLGLQG